RPAVMGAASSTAGAQAVRPCERNDCRGRSSAAHAMARGASDQKLTAQGGSFLGDRPAAARLEGRGLHALHAARSLFIRRPFRAATTAGVAQPFLPSLRLGVARRSAARGAGTTAMAAVPLAEHTFAIEGPAEVIA